MRKLLLALMALALSVPAQAQDAQEVAALNAQLRLCKAVMVLHDEHPDITYAQLVHGLAAQLGQKGVPDEAINQVIVTCAIYLRGVEEGRSFQK